MNDNTVKNIEHEVYELLVTSAGETVTSVGKSFRTKIEHDKIIGILFFAKGAFRAEDIQGKVLIELNKKRLLGDSFIPKNLYEKSAGVSTHDVMYKCDIDIKASDIDITFVDETPALSFAAYKFQVIFLTTKHI